MSARLAIATLHLSNGARLGLCRLPGDEGDLAGDLAAILAWRPALVLSLTEASEMGPSGGLGDRLAAAGIGWRHWPIQDFGVPPDASWPTLAAVLHAVLDGGGALLVHCRGGRGRSGTVALRLMVERGEDHRAALTRLRAARPGAVETSAQLLWALRGRRRSPHGG